MTSPQHVTPEPVPVRIESPTPVSVITSKTATIGAAIALGVLIVNLVRDIRSDWRADVAAQRVEFIASQASKKVEEVKNTLVVTERKNDKVLGTLVETVQETDVKADRLAKVAKDTHTLVNSNMGVQLQLNSTLARRLAAMTKDPDDIAAANLAEKILKDHLAKQDVVDQGTAATQRSGGK